MKFLRSGMLLAGAATLVLIPTSAPAARNIKAKPDPAACAEARSRGQTLPGCPRPEEDPRDPEGRDPEVARRQAQLERERAGRQRERSDSPHRQAAEAAQREAAEREARQGFMVCPGDARCPK